MRRHSLDELAQLFNVLLGEMSLVGPRPLLAQELPDYGAVITLYERVRPGLTGLWQISGRSHTTFAQRVSYDEWYIKNWTVWYDVGIMLQTLWVLLQGGGPYKPAIAASQAARPPTTMPPAISSGLWAMRSRN